MKRNLLILSLTMALVGCGSSKLAESERKLAEAEQKLDEATKALKAAQDASAGANTKVVETSQATVKEHAGNVEAAAKATQAAAQEHKDPKAAEAAQKSAATAAVHAEQARQLAEPPKMHTVPAGTTIRARTFSALSTKTTTAGSVFEASLESPIVVDGYTVAPKGATVEGTVTESDSGGRVKGRAVIAVPLREIKITGGQMVEVATSAPQFVAKSTVKRDAVRIGIASGIGAAIGAIAGGGKGAAIGAGAGAAGGTGLTLATKGDASVIPAETVIAFRLSESFTVTEVRK